MPKKETRAVPASSPEAAPKPVQQSEARQGPGPAQITTNGQPAPVKEKPVHEIRIGKIKAVIWANHTESGIRHNVTLRRLFKRDTNPQWEQSDSFGRDDLPVLLEVTRAAWLWIYAHSGQG